MTRIAPEEFTLWVNEEMKKRNWSIRETARQAGLSHSVVSNVVNGDMPTFNTCASLAEAFNEPPLNVFEIAGLLPEVDRNNPNLDAVNHKFAQLPAWQQKMVLRFIDSLIDEETGENENPKTQVADSHA